ncbi:MAG: lipocalin-like domain-containing protein [Vicinamibacteria bacterium]
MGVVFGTWRLLSIESAEPDPRGAHPTGLIYYDAAGSMAVQIIVPNAASLPRTTPASRAASRVKGSTSTLSRNASMTRIRDK